MKKAIASLKSCTPYSQSKQIEIAKKPKETHADFEKRSWRDRMHVKDGSVFIHGISFKNCIAEAAKYLGEQIPGKGKATYTKHFEAGVSVPNGVSLGISPDEVEREDLFVPSDGKRGSGSRVMKYFPKISEWEADVTFLILDETITEEVFTRTLDAAGKFIGIGRWRPRNNGDYGRFVIKGIRWEDS